jgi:hypothetical protein
MDVVQYESCATCCVPLENYFRQCNYVPPPESFTVLCIGIINYGNPRVIRHVVTHPHLPVVNKVEFVKAALVDSGPSGDHVKETVVKELAKEEVHPSVVEDIRDELTEEQKNMFARIFDGDVEELKGGSTDDPGVLKTLVAESGAAILDNTDSPLVKTAVHVITAAGAQGAVKVVTLDQFIRQNAHKVKDHGRAIKSGAHAVGESWYWGSDRNGPPQTWYWNSERNGPPTFPEEDEKEDENEDDDCDSELDASLEREIQTLMDAMKDESDDDDEDDDDDVERMLAALYIT